MKQRRTVVFLLALIALISGLVTGRPLLYRLAYILGLLLIASFLWAWVNINYLHVSRVTRSRRTQVGESMDERFSIRNTSILPKLWVEMRDASTMPGHFVSRVIANLGSKKSYRWRAGTRASERGRYRLGPLTMRSSDPFGLFTMEKEIAATTNVVVYPLTVDIPVFPLPTGILPGGDALRRRTHHVTTNAVSVREYAPGDSFGRIHWKTSARRNRLMVKEFELDPLADIWIVADLHGPYQVNNRIAREDSALENKSFQLPRSTEEYTVTIAASLSQHFLKQDRAVGMIAYGQQREILQPDRGERQQNRVLETLAVLKAQGKTSLEDVMASEVHNFPRGTTVCVVTPTRDPRWAATARQLLRRGLRLVVVLVDPQSFGSPESNADLLAGLQGYGVATYSVRYGDNISAVLSIGFKTIA